MVWSLIVIVFLASADQLLKTVVRTSLSPQDSIQVINGFFYLVHRSNPGAAFSLLANREWGIYLLIVISSVVTVAMLVIIYHSRHFRLTACLSLICAGSLGNLVDRIRYKAVTDYLDFHFGSFIFPTFNLADILIVCGTFLLALLILTDQHLFDNWAKGIQKNTVVSAIQQEETDGNKSNN